MLTPIDRDERIMIIGVYVGGVVDIRDDEGTITGAKRKSIGRSWSSSRKKNMGPES